MQSVLGLAGKLAGQLISPVFKEYISEPWLHGSKDEFEKLKKTMLAINAVLLDAEERQQTNNQIQHWLREIKLAFYDVEDLLQEVTTQALKDQAKTRKRKRKDTMVRIPNSLPNTTVVRYNMGSKVKSIREKLDATFKDGKIFKFTQRDESRSKKREETHSLVLVEKFIGREDDKKDVTKLLVESDVAENVSVVSVIGIGGMGKTTLAQSVYNSEEVKSKFELRMWVCVSDPFDVKLICENIIMSVTHTRCHRLPMEVVKNKLESCIHGRKYLLVLDDVWNEKQMEWDKLEVLLAGGGKGSKILITARAELVARAARSNAIHVLKGLSPEDSWVLFKQIAFKRGVGQVSPTMEGIGKEVLEKCVGVPLVVKAMGSILALKEKEIDWLDFKKYDLPRVTQGSEGTVFPILRLSYDYLSGSLKRCFVYCAIYPKDYEIEKEELIGMWMANGLIQLDGTTRSIEDVGERHFMDLLDRSFFEVQRTWRDEHGRIFTLYKMHDLIRDLAQSVGGDQYYNLGSGAECMVKYTRHARVYGDELTNIGLDGEKLHTLFVNESAVDERKLKELTSSTFEQLRVLRMSYFWLTGVPQFVGGLRHLYYLDLSGNDFVSLPESICSLYNLQTLTLSHCSMLEELPVGTRDLRSLRRLDITGCHSLRYMPRGLEELTCLQTLSDFVCVEEGGQRGNYAEVCELKSLVNLKGSLEIRNLRGGSLANAKCERKRSCILAELKLITELDLGWKDGQYEEELKEEEEEAELLLIESLKPHPNLERLLIERYPGKKFPSWMDRVNIGVSLPNIVRIDLYHCWSLRHVAALGLLPSLKELTLLHMDKLERLVEPTESSGSTTHKKRYFPVLEKLEISECPLFLADGRNEDGKQLVSLLEVYFSCEDTKTLPSGLQYVPHLQTLKIGYCHDIVSLPEWIGDLTSLQQLRLQCLSSLASIPDCMQRLTSLQRLQIDACGKLESRCKKGTGVDWHKIAHIPNINVIKSSANKERYFPVLEKLEIVCCPDGDTLPSGLQYVPHLQTLTLNHCLKLVSLPVDGRPHITSAPSFSTSPFISIDFGLHATSHIDLQLWRIRKQMRQGNSSLLAQNCTHPKHKLSYHMLFDQISPWHSQLSELSLTLMGL